MAPANITSLQKTGKKFKPSAAFSEHSHIQSSAEYQKLYNESIRHPDRFWLRVAKELRWLKPWKKLIEWREPFAKWFIGGQINICDNCVDRHSQSWRRNKAAIIWEGEPGEQRTLTYGDLQRDVCKFANVLRSQGIKKGDRVIIYLPLVPEAAIAMLACVRIGAVHSVVFGGFSSQALCDRIKDCKAKMVITADGGVRKGTVIPLKKNVDAALRHCSNITKVIVLKRAKNRVSMKKGRDVWWHEVIKKASSTCPAERLTSEHPSFILYTSGSTGKPKGVLHTTAGYLLGSYLTTKYVFDLKEEDTFWCTADIGWITGHSYTIYGALANGATTLMYEGAPNWPEPDRFWQIIDKYQVTIFYTAPTAIRAFMRFGDKWPKKHNLGSLRLLGTVGEPINPEAWMWYHEVIGKKRCPIVDTWWQTETGSIMITPLPGVTATKPGSAAMPFFGVDAAVVDKTGKELPADSGGYLVIRKPWPSMLRTIYGDAGRYKKQYWSEIPHVYFTGDGCRRDRDGYFWIVGRIDDVLNVSGHRIGTAEVESALVAHPKVVEAAVVGKPDSLKGQAIVAFVTLQIGGDATAKLKEELCQFVGKQIGSLAKPDIIRFSDALPKTRSGKIMRRLLKDIATGHEVSGDTTTLEDFRVLAKLKQDEE